MSDSGKTDGKDLHWLDRSRNRHRTHFRRRPSRREWERERLLRDWYGRDAGRLEALAHQRPSQSIREALPRVLDRLGLREGSTLSDLQKAWSDLVGSDVARFTLPVALRGGTLQIEVGNASWMYVLENMHKDAILAAVKTYTGGEVKTIRFVPAGRRRAGGR